MWCGDKVGRESEGEGGRVDIGEDVAIEPELVVGIRFGQYPLVGARRGRDRVVSASYGTLWVFEHCI